MSTESRLVNRRDVLKFASLFAAGAMVAPFARAADGAKPRILFFTKSAGFNTARSPARMRTPWPLPSST